MTWKNSKNLKDMAVQLIKFCGVGVINTAVNFGLFQLLIMIGPEESAFPQYKYIAQTVSYVLAVLCSYLLNRHFTFKAGGQKAVASAIKMYIQSGIVFLIMQGLLWLCYDQLMIRPEILAKLVATVPTTLLNFLGSKFWVFRTKEEPKK